MPASGVMIGPFRLVRRLGVGGVSRVYRAEDTRINRAVALKLLNDDMVTNRAFVARFHAEARAAARLNHPNIIRIFEIGETDGGAPFVVMELLGGRPLSTVLGQRGRFGLAETLSILEQIATALDYLHARGVVHGDLRPASINLGDDGQTTLMDSGIARSVEASGGPASLRVAGAPAYLAPEQIGGRLLEPAVDQYALGVIAFEMLAGRTPFSGVAAEVLRAHVYQVPPALSSLVPSLTPAISDVIAKQLAKKPGDRYTTAGEFTAALTEAAADKGGRQAAAEALRLGPVGGQATSSGELESVPRQEPVPAEADAIQTTSPAPSHLTADAQSVSPLVWWLGAGLLLIVLVGVIVILSQGGGAP